MTRLRARLVSAGLAMILSLVLGVAGFELVSRRVGPNLPTLEDPSEREKLFAYDATKGSAGDITCQSQTFAPQVATLLP